MIVTTGNGIEGRQIASYQGLVFGELVTGISFIKDIGAGIRDIFGGRAKGYEEELIRARQEVIQEMTDRARAQGADAIIGVKMDYEALGDTGSMMLVSVSGTAVKLEP